MQISRVKGLIGASAMAMLLSGCALTGSQIASPSHPAPTLQTHRLDFLSQQYRSHALVWQANPGQGWISPDAATQHLVYVSDEGGQAVYIFPQKGHNQQPI